ncbi:MAG: AAA family ATPase [Gammaproteobacteria bacterium]|nr:AAA family ATPase [Gammaproteobacteria bacterium]
MKIDITHMLKPVAYDHPVKNIELIETHISWVILTGDFVYKIKKPVNYGFLDFSTLEKRHQCCLNELRLNRRLAPAIYLDVVSITGTEEKPVIAGSGEVFEYAVKMKQFPQSAQLDFMLAAGELRAEHMDAIANMVADFHRHIDIADGTMNYGNNDILYLPVTENFEQIRDHLDITPYTDTLARLQSWNKSTFEKLATVFEQRKQNGFVRECHGDIHLRNLVWLEDGPTAFDCIEFNVHLRWIDVISEVAFLVMDLQDRQQPHLANRFLNSYLEATGDYAGLAILRFYLCYRALVRAKVDALRLAQKNISEQGRQQTLTEFESYLRLASTYTLASTPELILMRGLSASGKSTVAQLLVDATGMIRIRSDVERKRLFSLPLTSNVKVSHKIDAGIYSQQASLQTYSKLIELVSLVINAGYSVIVDAAFLKYEQRVPFLRLAESLGVAYTILEVSAPEEILRQRIVEKRHDVSDADLTVLEHQIANWQPLHEDEKYNTLHINTGQTYDIKTLITELNERKLNIT